MSVNSANSEDPLTNLIKKYKNYPNRAILDKSPNTSFSLKTNFKKDIEKEILNLNVVKASQDSDIPTKIIKKNSDIFSDIPRDMQISRLFENGKRYSCLQKRNRSGKDNYLPVSILPNMSKMFERCLCKKNSTSFEISFLSINPDLGKNIVLNTVY